MAAGPSAVEIRRSGEVPVLPHSVKLAGSPETLQWPSVCACCGAAAAEALPVTRVFSRDWRYTPAARSVDHFSIISVRTLTVPFCGACATRHRQEARPVGVFGALMSVFSTVYVIPFIVAAGAVLLYFFPLALGPARALVAAPTTAAQAAVFALAAAGFAAAVWYQTRRRRVTPPTAVTRAFDFSDNLAGIFGVEYRVYGMENERFAQAFRDANQNRHRTGR